MKYKLPKTKDKPDGRIKSVMFRLPLEMIAPFNQAVRLSGLSAQMVVESMVRHCLDEVDEIPTKKL